MATEPKINGQAIKKVVIDEAARIPQEHLLQFFEYGHLPAHMQDTSRLFHDLAHSLIASLPRNPERTMALRRLLEAKDCAVRAKIFKQ